MELESFYPNAPWRNAISGKAANRASEFVT